MVLRGWQRTCRKVVEGARRIVRGVEIHPRRPAGGQRHTQKPAAAVGSLAVGAICEHHEQCLIVWILQHCIEAPFMPVPREYQRARTVHCLFQAEYVDDLDVAVGLVRLEAGIEYPPGIDRVILDRCELAPPRTIDVPDPYAQLARAADDPDPQRAARYYGWFAFDVRHHVESGDGLTGMSDAAAAACGEVNAAGIQHECPRFGR